MNKKEQTIDTYNKSAAKLAQKFDLQGVRTTDIEQVFKLLKKDNPKVLEIGCGNGRDAQEIIKRTTDYIGIDISEGLIRIAEQNLPKSNFQIADIETYEFPKNLDIIFAFASLIHISKESLKEIFNRAITSLTPGGIFFISLKYGPYEEVTKEDEYGIRTHYLYTPEEIVLLAPQFTVVTSHISDIRGQLFFETMLRKD